MDFVDFEKNDFPLLLRPRKGEVYILFYVVNGEEKPFYVGQTARFSDRMADYEDAHFAACTDFKVGQAIRYLRNELRCHIVVKHKESLDRCKEERQIIERLQQEGFTLLNHCPSYDYKKTSEKEAENLVQQFCRTHYCSSV